MRKAIIFSVIALIFQSCNTLKVIYLLKSGNITERAYLQETSFEVVGGIILLKIKINGQDYDFMLDTGAPNVISTDLAKELKCRVYCMVESSDSQGNKDSMTFTRLDSLSIGNLTYLKQGAAIADFKKIKELSCLKIDGIIGANSMKKSIWQIDMLNKKIIITNNIGTLNIPQKAGIVEFSNQFTGIPLVDINIEGIVFKNVVFDYGSDSNIDISTDKISEILLKIDNSVIKSYGMKSLGLYGGKNDTIYTVLPGNILLDNYPINKQIVDLKKTGESTIGTELLKNYIVTIDWSNKKIYLEAHPQNNQDIANELNTFGFGAKLEDNNLVVVYLIENSPALNAGISIGDQILSIDGKDYTNLDLEGYCDIVINGLIDDKVNDIEMVIKMKDSTKKVLLKREKML